MAAWRQRQRGEAIEGVNAAAASASLLALRGEIISMKAAASNIIGINGVAASRYDKASSNGISMAGMTKWHGSNQSEAAAAAQREK